MNMLKPQKIKEQLNIQAGKWTDKVALAAAIGVTGIAVWVAVKAVSEVKKRTDILDLKLDDIDWDGFA